MHDDEGTNGTPPAKPSALRTFLIADVRGYTRFTHERGDHAAAQLAGRFARLARHGITAHGGELLELRGDEALGVFGSAREALRAAVELQRLFRAGTDDEPGLPLGVGIGIDAGEAVPVEGGYRGGALNLAARLCSRAAPGEILASETVVSLARHIDDIRLTHRGTERVKGIEEPVGVFEVVPHAELPRLPSTRFATMRRFRRRHVTRRNGTAGAVIAVTAAVVSTAVFAFGPGTGVVSSAPDTTRVGLVLPREPTGSEDLFGPYVDALLEAERQYGLQAEVLVDDPSRPVSEAFRERLGDFDLLLLGGATVHDRLLAHISANPDSHFVLLDPHPGFEAAGAEKLPNYTDIFFAEGPPAFMAAYIGVLMVKARSRGTARPVVSLVGIGRDASENQVAGFTMGARAADPDAVVIVDYVGLENISKPLACAQLAHRQIDRGSRVIYAPAGACGLGALSAASLRGVWGIGADVDRSYLGPHILVSVVKRLDRAVEYSIRSFLDGTLHQGKLDIGVERDAVGIVGINPAVSADVRSKLARQARRHDYWANVTPIEPGG